MRYLRTIYIYPSYDDRGICNKHDQLRIYRTKKDYFQCYTCVNIETYVALTLTRVQTIQHIQWHRNQANLTYTKSKLQIHINMLQNEILNEQEKKREKKWQKKQLLSTAPPSA